MNQHPKLHRKFMAKLFFSSCCIGLMTASANAQMVISNWTATTNSLMFDIAGSIPAGATLGPAGQNLLYIGVPNDTDWISAAKFGATITHNSGKTWNFGGVDQRPGGDYAYLGASSNWAHGDTADASVSLTGINITPGNLVPDDIIVSVGWLGSGTPPFPDPAYQVGGFAAVPEVSSFALLGVCGLVVGGFSAIRRYRS